MARVANTKDIIANEAVSYVINELNNALKDFHEELNLNNKLKATYVSARDGSAKTHADNAIKMARWLYESQLGQTPPTPYSDTEVDTINIDIRTHEV